MHVYVFWRMASVPIVAKHFSPIILAIAGVILWGSFLLPRFLENREWDVIAQPLEYFGTNWLGVLFLLFICLLAADILTGFGFLSRFNRW